MLRHFYRQSCLPYTLKQSCARPSTLSSGPTSPPRQPHVWHREFRILAIETSCDDTCLAILDLRASPGSTFRTASLLYNERVTSNNLRYGGVHPLRSMESHQENLARLVAAAMDKPDFRIPDLIAVTRGPGMRNNLQCGLDTAKGLSVAWRVPLIGIHHMQAHALAPRLQHALAARHASTDNPQHPDHEAPTFPFLSLLVSGGHTLLVQTHSLTEHRILASTTDIAIGDCLDKVARVVLPQDVLDASNTVAYGALLETFAFDQKVQPAQRRYEYVAPRTLGEEYEKGQVKSEYGWHFPAPLLTKDGKKFRAMEFSFGGISSHAHRIVLHGATHGTPRETPMGREEAKVLAQRSMRSAFEHLASRIVLFLDAQRTPAACAVETHGIIDNAPTRLAIGGGVAANFYLRHILETYLSARGFSNVKLSTVTPSLCVDNAAMIAWTAAEMVGATSAGEGFKLAKADHQKYLSMRAIRKWSLENLLTPEKEEERERREEKERDLRQKQGPLDTAQFHATASIPVTRNARSTTSNDIDSLAEPSNTVDFVIPDAAVRSHATST